MTLRNTLIEELGQKRYEELLNIIKNTPLVADEPIRSILDYTGFQNFNGTIIALENTEKFSSLYKISIEDFSKDLVVQIPTNLNEKSQGLPFLKFDLIKEYALYNTHLVYIVRKKESVMGLPMNPTDHLMITDLATKESKQLCEWKTEYFLGNVAMGNPAPAIEHSKIHLEDEWIFVERDIPSPSIVRPLDASTCILKAFKIRYDGTEMNEVTSE